MQTILTESGSIYEIDFEARTWKQTKRDNDAIKSNNPLRTTEGAFFAASLPEVGQCFRMMCPPLVKGASMRVIITSPVTHLIEGDENANVLALRGLQRDG